jgi:CelD/BcsL family acetyltransferase involved in cellulose biosynthesis
VVSAIYGFVERDEFFLYQMGWDGTFARLSPGKMAMRWSIINAIQRGVRVYDMLPGDYEYKRQWGDSTRWVLDLEAANPASWRASVFHALRHVRRRFAVKPIPEGLAA